MLNLFEIKSIEESLGNGLITMKGLNLKYSITMWVTSSCTNKLTSLGRLDFPLTISK